MEYKTILQKEYEKGLVYGFYEKLQRLSNEFKEKHSSYNRIPPNRDYLTSFSNPKYDFDYFLSDERKKSWYGPLDIFCCVGIDIGSQYTKAYYLDTEAYIYDLKGHINSSPYGMSGSYLKAFFKYEIIDGRNVYSDSYYTKTELHYDENGLPAEIIQKACDKKYPPKKINFCELNDDLSSFIRQYLKSIISFDKSVGNITTPCPVPVFLYSEDIVHNYDELLQLEYFMRKTLGNDYFALLPYSFAVCTNYEKKTTQNGVGVFDFGDRNFRFSYMKNGERLFGEKRSLGVIDLYYAIYRMVLFEGQKKKYEFYATRETSIEKIRKAVEAYTSENKPLHVDLLIGIDSVLYDMAWFDKKNSFSIESAVQKVLINNGINPNLLSEADTRKLICSIQNSVSNKLTGKQICHFDIGNEKTVSFTIDDTLIHNALYYENGFIDDDGKHRCIADIITSFVSEQMNSINGKCSEVSLIGGGLNILAISDIITEEAKKAGFTLQLNKKYFSAARAAAVSFLDLPDMLSYAFLSEDIFKKMAHAIIRTTVEEYYKEIESILANAVKKTILKLTLPHPTNIYIESIVLTPRYTYMADYIDEMESCFRKHTDIIESIKNTGYKKICVDVSEQMIKTVLSDFVLDDIGINDLETIFEHHIISDEFISDISSNYLYSFLQSKREPSEIIDGINRLAYLAYLDGFEFYSCKAWSHTVDFLVNNIKQAGIEGELAVFLKDHLEFHLGKEKRIVFGNKGSEGQI